MTNQAGWATLVLSDAGLPVTSTNVTNIMRWMAAEEPPVHWWSTNDPLNLGHPTTDPSGALASLTVAARLVAAALSDPAYAGIRGALATSSSVTIFSTAVVLSPWSSNHYGGTPDYFAHVPIPPLYTAPSTPVPPPPVTNPLPKGLDIMSVAVATGRIFVTGVSGGHKFLFVVPVTQESNGKAYSIMDLSDVAAGQHVAGTADFTS